MHYNNDYFEWQKDIGLIGGDIDKFKFEPYINIADTVIDFGCGGGYILSNLNCKRKIGIEINSTAREYARNENGIETFPDVDSVPDKIADVIISHHALEHTEAPYDIIVKLSSKLKNTGKIVFVVPSEKKMKYNPGDINMHLYTWSEQNIGNLFKKAGYHIDDIRQIKHNWPPIVYRQIYHIFGRRVFHIVSCIWGRICPNITQIRIVAKWGEDGSIEKREM